MRGLLIYTITGFLGREQTCKNSVIELVGKKQNKQAKPKQTGKTRQIKFYLNLSVFHHIKSSRKQTDIQSKHKHKQKQTNKNKKGNTHCIQRKQCFKNEQSKCIAIHRNEQHV